MDDLKKTTLNLSKSLLDKFKKIAKGRFSSISKEVNAFMLKELEKAGQK